MAESKEPMRFQEREERIRAKAQELWEKEGRPEGKADQHWYRAATDIDREVESETGTEPASAASDRTASGMPLESGESTPVKQTELVRHQDKQAKQGETQGQQSTTSDKDRYPGQPQRNESADKNAQQARENLDKPTPRA